MIRTSVTHGVLPTWRLGAFDDVEATLRQSLARLRSCRELPVRDRIRGFIFDPDTGTLRGTECRR
jgi:carbonic anhydrase